MGGLDELHRVLSATTNARYRVRDSLLSDLAHVMVLDAHPHGMRRTRLQNPAILVVSGVGVAECEQEGQGGERLGHGVRRSTRCWGRKSAVCP